MLASLQSTRTVTSERPTEQCNPGRLLSRVIGFDTGLKRCRFEDTAVGQLPPSPGGLYDVTFSDETIS